MSRLRLCLALLISVLALNCPAKEVQPVSLQLLWKNQFQFAGYYIAKEKGFYAEEQLEVDIREYKQDTDIVGSIINHQADFAVGRSSILVSKGNGAPITALFATFQKSPFMLITRGDIKTPAELKGKRVMLTDQAHNVAEVQAMLIKAGVSANDYIHQEHSFNISDLINKKTDVMGAYTSNEPYQMQLQQQPFAIIHPADYGFDMYSDILFTHNDTLTNKPLLTSKFYKASIKGWLYAFENIEETSKIIYEKYNTQNRTLDALIYEGIALKKLALIGGTPFGEMVQERFKEMETIYLISGHLNPHYDISNFIYQGNRSSDSDMLDNFPVWQTVIFMLIVISYLIYRNNVATLRNTELIVIAEHDQLTGLYNRHKLIESISEYIQLSIRYNWKISCIFVDIDNFKVINDTFGHNAGDQVLKDISQLLVKMLRRTDIIGRWGGEEFVIILPETDLLMAEEIAAKLRIAVFEAKFSIDHTISCSLGVTQYKKDETVEEFIGRADDALYIAKHAGKNRTAVL
ncbi:diguanylate cyclase [Neptunomonas sp.]|uniref:diguanylate cyclase n=1 Tax=Neptunomonas sp. TaxID=1971898 RepID=UPI0035681A01